MMKMATKIIQAQDDIWEPICKEIFSNKTVAIPTETVYGLAGNAFSEEACKEIFRIKGRPSDNPLIVHINGMDMLSRIVDVNEIPSKIWPIMKKFWPGPLTILFPCIPHNKGGVCDQVTAGLPTVAVRFPSHPLALKLISLTGLPLAAPSANLSGGPSPTTAKHVFDDLNGRIPYILDGDKCCLGIESTVIDCLQDPPLILRPGSITKTDLLPFLPNIQTFDSLKRKDSSSILATTLSIKPSTPGMKYRHYSPNAPLILLRPINRDDCFEEKVVKFITEKFDTYNNIIRITSHLTMDFPISKHSKYMEIKCSSTSSSSEIAQNLFDSLRMADSYNPSLIIIEDLEDDDDINLGINNRIEKASSSIIYL